MLIGLSVRDIVLIEKLDLAVEPGLTALTGETGAGKSILLDALGLAAGGKADRALVRSGADRGVVAAEFRAAKRHPVWNALAENGLSSADGASDGYVILRREQRADGATRAFVNDEPVSVGLLRRIGDSLIETHGQNDGHGFLRTEAHRAMLDAFASASALKEETAVAAARLGAAEEALAAWRARQADSAQEAAYLSEIVKDLSALAPEEGEEARLAAERAALMSVERIAGDVSDAADALAADSGVEARLAGALKRLEAALGKLEGDAADGGGPLGAALGAGVASLDRALLEAQEAREALERLAAAVDADPAALETTEARLFALRAAARKYATSADRLPALRAEAAEKLAGLEDAATGEATLLAETKAAARAYDEA
ncbi:MAG: AAA family ATPase, partial [Pseudomonadota bacterium]